MTAAEVAGFDSGEALVAYLAQRDASPAVCDVRSRDPHITRFDRDTATTLVSALEEGRVDPQLWQRCVGAALEGGSRDAATQLVDAVGDGYHELAGDRAIETSPPLQARLAALQAVYIQRPNGRNGDPKTMSGVFDDLRRRFFGGRFGPVAAHAVNELLGAVELELGRYGGRPVDTTMIAYISANGDETLLRLVADRLPMPDLRAQARRRLIRLRIARSPFPEVRAQAAVIEDRVVQQGINPVVLADQPAVGATFDAGKLPARGVVVQQDMAHQTASLFGNVAGKGLSVVPNVELGGALWVQVAGLSRPITVCGAPRSDDPTPCIAGKDVAIENPLASSDGDGTFRFRDKTTEGDVLNLTSAKDLFPLSIDVGGRQLVSLGWPIRFERPVDLVLASRSGRGPDLTVAIGHPNPQLFVFTVSGKGLLYRAAVQETDLAKFHVVSRGATGAAGTSGANGSDGMAGTDGMSASCSGSSGSDGSPGGDGGNGGDGGPGGDGADGGDMFVQLDPGAAGCSADDVAILRRQIFSQGGFGGPGGAGGFGGRGGRGGSGGSSASCFDPTTNTTSSVSGGSDGASGRDGANGSAGRDGSPGRPGQVRFQVVAAAH
jgi:hypothetical protein